MEFQGLWCVCVCVYVCWGEGGWMCEWVAGVYIRREG